MPANVALFGFEIKKKPEKQLSVLTAQDYDDGALQVIGGSVGGFYSVYMDIDGNVRSDADMITKYRDMANFHTVDQAIGEITNEAIISDDVEKSVKINLDDCEMLTPQLKNVIEDEFNEILKLYEFNNDSFQMFRQWYIDGRSYYQIVIDKQHPEEGIKELKYIDSRKMKKVREIKAKKEPNGIIVQTTVATYFIFNDKGFNSKGTSSSANINSTTQGVKISPDAVIYVPSGLMNTNGETVLSYLYKAIKPLNCLQNMEDALVIYRLVRAPERRIFYIDVGGLPKLKAEQHIKDQMTKFKNRVVYNSATGEIDSIRKFQIMLDDYWFGVRNGKESTKVETLPTSGSLSNPEDILYFQKELFRALNVPLTRLDPEGTYSIGKATEITRDEVAFAKFINRLRRKFSQFFLQALRVQLILKNILTDDDWKVLKSLIKFEYTSDNVWDELKQTEIETNRANLANLYIPFVGRYISNTWLRKNVLKQSDEEIEQIDSEIGAEMQIPQYALPTASEAQENGPPTG